MPRGAARIGGRTTTAAAAGRRRARIPAWRPVAALTRGHGHRSGLATLGA
ncbi:hypothetical protein FM117_00520 [Micrococcus luteus Mu201]|nr:hypothetical protein FM117_00520 [Micrococcus luteus Mu201]